MSDMGEKLIVKLGHRISEQKETLRMIAASLEGIESHLRQIANSLSLCPWPGLRGLARRRRRYR